MPAFQQECSLSWDYKNWLLAQGRGRLSLEPACSFNSGCSLVCQGVGLLYLKCPNYLRSLFWINSLLSEILCVWKFVSNQCLDCHDANHLYVYDVLLFSPSLCVCVCVYNLLCNIFIEIVSFYGSTFNLFLCDNFYHHFCAQNIFSDQRLRYMCIWFLFCFSDFISF